MVADHLLQNSKVDPAEVEIFIAHLLGKDRAFIKAFPELNLSREQTHKLKNFLKRRIKNEPLNYILGYKDFCGLRFKIDGRAMIPRPETERLVTEVVGHVYALPNRSLRALRPFHGLRERPNHFSTETLTIVDVGTGCGNIAISLAKAVPFAKIYAVEKNSNALSLARENIKDHGVGNQVELFHGDLLAPIKEPVDIIVANLPYIPTSRINSLQPEIRDWEPREALDGGPDGLGYYRRLFNDARQLLKPYGQLFYELDGKTFIQRV